jgi:hypothetical protein
MGEREREREREGERMGEREGKRVREREILAFMQIIVIRNLVWCQRKRRKIEDKSESWFSTFASFGFPINWKS